jgi:chorismate synthase
MAGSTHGTLLRVTTFGESHGPAMGCILDGCPAGLPITAEEIQIDLDRRRPGQSRLTTPRKEADAVEILSGVFEGRTLGTPIALLVPNKNADPGAYDALKDLYRPSHADFTWEAKFGHRDHRGGGRSSARETVGRVAAGAIARKLLSVGAGIEIVGWVDAVQEIGAAVDPETVSRDAVDANDVRCPDAAIAEAMEARIREVRAERDTLGGVVGAVARGVPAGLGAPVFDRLEADLARAMLSIPAAKGFESGSGFGGTLLRGSGHNDPFAIDGDGAVVTTTNRSGGVQGGISNGMPVTLRVAFKPVATHFQPQQTVTKAPHAPTEFQAKGRHDPCVLPRAVPIVEAMMALVLADHWLRQRALSGAAGDSL